MNRRLGSWRGRRCTVGLRDWSGRSSDSAPFLGEHGDDATALAPSFGPHLTADDLRGLAAHEVAMRLSIKGATRPPVTGITLPVDAGFIAGSTWDAYGGLK